MVTALDARRLFAALLALAALAALAAAVGLASRPLAGVLDEGSAPSGPTGAAHADAAPTPAQLAAGTLRTRRDAARDAIAAAVARSPLLADGIVDLASSRRVGVSGGRPAWLASTRDGASICALTAGALTCPPAAHLAEHGLAPALAKRPGGPVQLYGVAGDAVRSVMIVRADGASETLAVSRNFFAADLPAPPRAIRWIGPAGIETVRFPAGLGRARG